MKIFFKNKILKMEKKQYELKLSEKIDSWLSNVQILTVNWSNFGIQL